MDVSQSDVGKVGSSQGAFVKGKVIGISAMNHQDMDSLIHGNGQMIHPVFPNLRCGVAETVDLHIAVLKIDAAHLISHKKSHIGTPGKAEKSRTAADTIMIACDDDDVHRGDGSKKVVHLF